MKNLKKILYYIHSHFRAKLYILFFISTMIPTLLFLSVIYPLWYGSLKTKERMFAEDKVLLINESLDQIFQTIEKNMASIFTNTYIRQAIVSDSDLLYTDSYYQIVTVESILKSISNYSEDGYSYTLIDHSNQVYTNGSSLNLLESFDGELCSNIKNAPSGQTYFTTRYIYNSDKERTLTFAKALSMDGVINAILIVDITPHFMDALMATYNSQNYSVVIFNSEQEVIYTNNMIPLEQLDGKYTLLSRNKQTQVEISGIRYEKVLAQSVFSHCTTCILIPESLIYQESLRLRWQMLLILFIILGQTILFSNIVSRNLSSQIILLKDEITEFIQGRQKHPSASRKCDEITEIANGVSYLETELEKMILRIQEDEKRKRYLELKALQQQINPHMIYNTLNTISKLAQLQGISNIEEVCAAFSGMLKLISKTTGDFITIRQEVTFIQNYIILKRYNSYQEYLLTLEIDDTVYEVPILKLLLQPFIENSILHGFQSSNIEGRILLSVSLENNWIHIIIEDNGCGIPKEKLDRILASIPSQHSKDENSTGIRNCIERLHLQYGSEQYFKIESDGKTYTRIQLGYLYRENNL